jgi:hypothetical protein
MIGPANMRSISYSVLLAAWIMLLPLCVQAGVYSWTDENGVTHYSNKKPEVPAEEIKKERSAEAYDRQIKVPKYGISLIEVELQWYLSRDPFQEEDLYHPMIGFAVRNDSDKKVAGLKFKAVFSQEKRIFGESVESLEDLPPDFISSMVVLRPSMGYVYNGTNKPTIIANKFDIDLFLIHEKKEVLIRKIPFYLPTAP